MKKIIIGALLFITATNISAQKTVGYTVLKDDPNDIKPFYMAFDILSADTWGTNSMMGYGIRSSFTYKGIGSIDLSYRKAYFDLEYQSAKEESTGNTKKHTALEFGVSLNLLGREKKADIPVVLASEMFFSPKGAFSQKITYLSVEGTKKWNLQVRGGLARFNVPFAYHYELGDSEGEDPRAFSIVKDTVTWPVGEEEGYTVSNNQGTLFTGITGMMKLNTFYVGLSSRSIRNLWISADGEGVCANTNEFVLFADALLLGGMAVGDGWSIQRYHKSASAYNQDNGWQLEIDKTKLKKMGWRVGFEARKYQNLAMTYKVEFGSRPGLTGKSGIIGNNAYLLLTAGFGFGVGKSVKVPK